MSEEKTNIISINGEEYNADDFDDKQKYLVAQCKSCQERVGKLRFDLDRETAALDHFTSALIATIEASKNTEKKVS
tara:strand:- start:1545 stop:1772 length:228 start_codon:yes stop_codon:yes gene_type:complete